MPPIDGWIILIATFGLWRYILYLDKKNRAIESHRHLKDVAPERLADGKPST